MSVVLLDLDDVVAHFERVKDDLQSAIDSLEERVNMLRDDSEMQINSVVVGDKKVNVRVDSAAAMFKDLLKEIEKLNDQNKQQQAEIDDLKQRVESLEANK